MTTKYVQAGDVITITAGASYTQGDLIDLTDVGGVVLETCATGDLVAVALEGVFTVPKKAAGTLDLAVGEKVTLLTTGGVEKAVPEGSGTEALGIAVEAAATGATTCKVKLCQF